MYDFLYYFFWYYHFLTFKNAKVPAQTAALRATELARPSALEQLRVMLATKVPPRMLPAGASGSAVPSVLKGGSLSPAPSSVANGAAAAANGVAAAPSGSAAAAMGGAAEATSGAAASAAAADGSSDSAVGDPGAAVGDPSADPALRDPGAAADGGPVSSPAELSLGQHLWNKMLEKHGFSNPVFIAAIQLQEVAVAEARHRVRSEAISSADAGRAGGLQRLLPQRSRFQGGFSLNKRRRRRRGAVV